MNFTTRAEYKAAVAEWKLQYAEQSTCIRELRAQFNAAQSAYSKALHTTIEDARAARQLYNTVEDTRRARQTAASAATALLSERRDGKVEAQRQYMLGL